MKLAIISANLGRFDPQHDHRSQSIEHDVFRFTDETYPPRTKAMTPRMQARIVKMFMWQFVKGYDLYLWVDSSCILSARDSAKWFVERLEDNDIAVFKHPNRNTVQEEADYLKKRLEKGCPYITPRYENELIDQQLKEVDPNAELYASTAFIMRNTKRVRVAMEEWWYHTSRYHIIDQLSLPWAIRNLRVKVIPDNYLKIPWLEYVRTKKQ